MNWVLINRRGRFKLFNDEIESVSVSTDAEPAPRVTDESGN